MRLRRHPAVLQGAKFWLLRGALGPIAHRRRATARDGGRIVFFDLGAADGNTARLALQAFPSLEKLILIEPNRHHVRLLRKAYADHSRVEIVPAAAGIEDRESVRLFQGTTYGSFGNSILSQKHNVDTGRFEEVPMIDFPKFLRDRVGPGQVAVLKIDIEGAEYDLFRALGTGDAWTRVAKVFCEWHWERIGMDRALHQETVIRLRRLGYDIIGVNRFDEFSQQISNRTYWPLGLTRQRPAS